MGMQGLRSGWHSVIGYLGLLDSSAMLGRARGRDFDVSCMRQEPHCVLPLVTFGHAHDPQ